MNDELLAEIIRTKESLDAFFAICDQRQAVHKKLLAGLNSRLRELAEERHLKCHGELSESKFSHIRFLTPGLEKHGLEIAFSFDANSYRDFVYGFVKMTPEAQGCPVRDQLKREFDKGLGCAAKESPNWPVWVYCEDPYRDWGEDAWIEVLSGRLAEQLGEKLEKMVGVANKICP